jgi:hypothetical protein
MISAIRNTASARPSGPGGKYVPRSGRGGAKLNALDAPVIAASRQASRRAPVMIRRSLVVRVTRRMASAVAPSRSARDRRSVSVIVGPPISMLRCASSSSVAVFSQTSSPLAHTETSAEPND